MVILSEIGLVLEFILFITVCFLLFWIKLFRKWLVLLLVLLLNKLAHIWFRLLLKTTILILKTFWLLLSCETWHDLQIWILVHFLYHLRPVHKTWVIRRSKRWLFLHLRIYWYWRLHLRISFNLLNFLNYLIILFLLHF